jgi:hypothetical protein
MNKISSYKLAGKGDIDQSLDEGEYEGESVLSVLHRGVSGNNIRGGIARVNTKKSVVSVDVDNINSYFIKEYNITNAIDKQIKSIIEERETMMDTGNEGDIIQRVLSCHKSSEDLYYLTNKSNNYKSILEEFIVIGIETGGLEYTDLEELYLTPKILGNYPNNLHESELKLYLFIIFSNIRFLKNFCFNEGVKVNKKKIITEEDFDQYILERNYFSKYNSSFCLVQQITPDSIMKYFIFGIRFDDIYIVNSESRGKNIFIYEKTYLIISYEPLCSLFEKIFNSILAVKKLNFQKNIEDYYSLDDLSRISQFDRENIELVSILVIILERG